MLPEFKDDEILRELIDVFDARVEYAHNRTQYIGTLTMRVRIGEANFVRLQTVRLLKAENKAALERARAGQFAEHLMGIGAESARSLWLKAAEWEGERFMAWVREDVSALRRQIGVSI